MKPALATVIGLVLTAALPSLASAGSDPQGRPDPPAAGQSQPYYLKDRGPGIPTSMFGIYVRRRELLVYPFFEYYWDNNLQYSPSEFGYPSDQDFEARYRASEGILFFAYGITDRLAFEFEPAVISASLQKDPNDPSSLPATLQESGVGDVQVQLDWLMAKENAHRPALFSYCEVVFPHHGEKLLIGTPDWEVKAGVGAIRGTKAGTFTARVALEYVAASDSPFDLGEWALEYLKRLSPSWRIYAGVEGQGLDELSLILEAQWSPTRNLTVILNNGIGLTPNATDWAPEVGIMFSFPGRTHKP